MKKEKKGEIRIIGGKWKGKKIYFNFGGFTYKEWPFSGGFPSFNVFNRHQKKWPLNNKEVGYFILHEVLHAMGGIYTCSPNYIEGHNTKKTKDMMSRSGDGTNHNLDPKNDDYWGHNNKTCPNMLDSVYFTPTSVTSCIISNLRDPLVSFVTLSVKSFNITASSPLALITV